MALSSIIIDNKKIYFNHNVVVQTD